MGNWITRDVDDLRRVMEPLEKKFDGDDEKIDRHCQRFDCGTVAREWRILKDWKDNPSGQNIKEMYTANVKATPEPGPAEGEDRQEFVVTWDPPGWYRRRDERFEERLRNTPW